MDINTENKKESYQDTDNKDTNNKDNKGNRQDYDNDENNLNELLELAVKNSFVSSSDMIIQSMHSKNNSFIVALDNSKRNSLSIRNNSFQDLKESNIKK